MKRSRNRAGLLLYILVTLITSQSAHAAGVVLWNKLGSDSEVLNSEIGPGFEIREDGGDVLFVDGVFGGALATTGGTANLGPAGGYLAMSPDEFFPADKTKGTVELWIQKQLPELLPFETSLVTFFGASRYATGYTSIMASWEDGYNVPDEPSYVGFSVYDGESHAARDLGWEAVPVGQWVHLAFVWDGSGIDGGPDDVRIYRDGVLVASHQGSFSEVVPYCCVGYSCGENICPDGYEVRVLANHEGRRLTGCPQYPSGYCPAAYMDNIIVWNYAKTDFSDRFNESPVGVGGSVTGIIPETGECLNETTGQDVIFALDGKTSWNCEAEGLLVDPGDRIMMTVGGTVPRVGDINTDGCIDRTDANILLEYVRNSGPYYADYDLNDDGSVNIADVRTLVLLFDNPGGAPCD